MGFPEGSSSQAKNEKQAELEQIAEAKKLLELLGEQHLIGRTFRAPDGRTLLVEEFPLVYRDKPGFYMAHVHPFYVALEANPSDSELKSAVREVVYSHLGLTPQAS